MRVMHVVVGLVMLVYRAAEGQPPDCEGQPRPEHSVEWQEELGGSTISVEWAFGKLETCTSLTQCFGLNVTEDKDLVAQIFPVQLQQGLAVKFFASRGLSPPLEILPYRVDRAGFEACDTSAGQPVIANQTQEEFLLDPKFLTPGSNYFITASPDPLYRCELGLRLNVTVRMRNCSGIGESATCWGHGSCLSTPWQSEFGCYCCPGYSGPYCQERDACLWRPCHDNATCHDLPDADLGPTFKCICPVGYYGNSCEQKADDPCSPEAHSCTNGSTCVRNGSRYSCACAAGYTGDHCEVDEDDCAAQPCRHGVCVDKVAGFQCYCVPGFGGSRCEEEYDECESSPCQHGGFCIDQEDGFSCHCSPGYTGQRCQLKVDLCNPGRCKNATECIDYGSTYSCTCRPGYMGHHCEININECESNPCQHDGRCFDEVAGYHCICAQGYTGNHCEYLVQPPPRQDLSYVTAFHHRSHLAKLAIVAGTLAGALLIALAVLAGCYLRLNHVPARRGYTRHKE